MKIVVKKQTAQTHTFTFTNADKTPMNSKTVLVTMKNPDGTDAVAQKTATFTSAGQYTYTLNATESNLAEGLDYSFQIVADSGGGGETHFTPDALVVRNTG